MNTTRKEIFLSLLNAAIGLSINAVGIYLTIRSNIGVLPWDVLCIGVSRTLHISYGTASIAIALSIFIADVLMHEKIGLGMILDIFLVGKVVDLLNFLDLVKPQTSLLCSIPMFFVGLFVMGYSFFLYMRVGLGCGPRDLFLIGLCRRLPKVTIGIVSIMLLSTVTLIGYFLGGPVGLGTLLGALFAGPIMDFAFRTVHFDAKAVRHQGFSESLRILLSRDR